MKPPEDAPLPWRWEESPFDDGFILDAAGNVVAGIDNPDLAAYAVAAANALPGLVELVEAYVRVAQCQCHAPFARQGVTCLHCGSRDALAALPVNLSKGTMP